MTPTRQGPLNREPPPGQTLLLDRDLLDRDPGQRIPSWTDSPLWTETPLYRDLPDLTWDQEQRTLEGTWDQVVRLEVASYKDPSVDKQTPMKILPILPCPKLLLRAVISPFI